MFHFTLPWPFSFKVFAAACALGIVALTLAAQDPPAEKGAAEDPFGKKGDAKGAKEGPEPKSAFDRNRGATYRRGGNHAQFWLARGM
jgi:hypothetical protein